jgi:hypothetical protein
MRTRDSAADSKIRLAEASKIRLAEAESGATQVNGRGNRAEHLPLRTVLVMPSSTAGVRMVGRPDWARAACQGSAPTGPGTGLPGRAVACMTVIADTMARWQA